MFAFHHVRNVFDSPGQKPGFSFGKRNGPSGWGLKAAGAVIPKRQPGQAGASIQRA